MGKMEKKMETTLMGHNMGFKGLKGFLHPNNIAHDLSVNRRAATFRAC